MQSVALAPHQQLVAVAGRRAAAAGWTVVVGVCAGSTTSKCQSRIETQTPRTILYTT